MASAITLCWYDLCWAKRSFVLMISRTFLFAECSMWPAVYTLVHIVRAGTHLISTGFISIDCSPRFESFLFSLSFYAHLPHQLYHLSTYPTKCMIWMFLTSSVCFFECSFNVNLINSLGQLSWFTINWRQSKFTLQNFPWLFYKSVD